MSVAEEDPRFLVVETIANLANDHTTHNALVAGIAHLAGVKCVYEFNELTGLTIEQLIALTKQKRRRAAGTGG